jgi:hypothetical protein
VVIRWPNGTRFKYGYLSIAFFKFDWIFLLNMKPTGSFTRTELILIDFFYVGASVARYTSCSVKFVGLSNEVHVAIYSFFNLSKSVKVVEKYFFDKI